MSLSTAREAICRFGRSLFERGLTPGSSGNISIRTEDGRFLCTPTNASLGFLDPNDLSLIDESGALISGSAPTKEIPLHNALYATRPGANAIVHLHSVHSVAVSLLHEIDPTDVLPPLTPYYVMRVGKTVMLPYFAPGDPAITEAIKDLGGRERSILLSNHGPVMAGATLQEAVFALEELEETAKLYLLTRGSNPRLLTQSQVAALRRP